jgi:hypothetical protein
LLESINGLFFRDEGAQPEIGVVLRARPIPSMLLELMLMVAFTPISKGKGTWRRERPAALQASDKSGGCWVAFSEPSASLSYSSANSSNLAFMARVVTPSATWRARAAFRR